MSPRTFQGQTMAEALADVKRCFGSHAVILSTRTVSRGGLLGFHAKPLVEITAARDMPALADTGRTRRLAATETRLSPPKSNPIPTLAGVGVTAEPAAPQNLLKEFVSLKSLVSDLVLESRRKNIEAAPGKLHDLYRNLIENAVAEDMAISIIRRLESELSPPQFHDEIEIRRRLSRILVESVPVSGPIVPATSEGPHMAALIGPTGVGKTTTVAKLAANFSLREHKKVGLITLDTYRIAAVEQLRTYAQIIDVPLKVAMSPDEYQDAVFAMSDRDIILIDSAGRSQRDAVKIQELKSFFALAAPHETHLVLSSASSERVMYEAIDRFRPIGINRVIFTKVDEAVGFGVILSALQKVQARLSYITTGQDVPSDIEVGEPKTLAEMMIGSLSAVQEKGDNCDAKN